MREMNLPMRTRAKLADNGIITSPFVVILWFAAAHISDMPARSELPGRNVAVVACCVRKQGLRFHMNCFGVCSARNAALFG